MAARIWFRGVVVLLLVGGVLGTLSPAQENTAWGVAVVNPYGALPGGWYALPPVAPTPYLPVPPPPYITPSFSYNANPYARVPNSFSYTVPPYNYAPNSYTYDLGAYDYGYPPAIYVPPPLVYPTDPAYPYGYRSGYRFSRRFYQPFRPLTLREYLRKEHHGPTEVRDIVPGIPALGG